MGAGFLCLYKVNTLGYGLCMDNIQPKIDRLSYYARPTEDVTHDPLIDTSDDCIAQQYEWSEDHVALGEGGFQRKNVIGDELTDTLL